MARGSGEQSDRMMRAAASGHAARTHAHDQLMAEQRATQNDLTQQAMQAGSLANQSDQIMRQDEHAKARLAEDQHQFDTATKLRAAESGFQWQGGGDRASKVDQEMAQGEQQTQALYGQQGQQGGVGQLDPESQERLRKQTSRSMEMDEGGRWIPTEERRQSQRFDQESKAFAAQTERIRAEAYREQVAASRMKASLSGDQEKVDKLTKDLEQPIISNTSRLDRLQQGDPTDNDWGSLKAMAESYGSDPQLLTDIEAQDWTPRVRQFLNMQINKDALKFISYTGHLPDVKKTGVDLTSPIMQQFTAAAGQVGQWMRATPPGMSQWMGIRSQEDKIEFVNRWAAMMTLSGMMLDAGGGDPMGGMVPSAGQPQMTGGQPQGASPLDQQRADAELRRGSAHPYANDQATQQAIAARGRGENVPPTDSREFQVQFGGENVQRNPYPETRFK